MSLYTYRYTLAAICVICMYTISAVTCDIEYMPEYDPEDEIDCQLDLAKFLPQKWVSCNMERML